MGSHFITINKNVPNFHCHRFVYLVLNKTFMGFCLEISKRFLCVCVWCVFILVLNDRNAIKFRLLRNMKWIDSRSWNFILTLYREKREWGNEGKRKLWRFSIEIVVSINFIRNKCFVILWSTILYIVKMTTCIIFCDRQVVHITINFISFIHSWMQGRRWNQKWTSKKKYCQKIDDESCWCWMRCRAWKWFNLT